MLFTIRARLKAFIIWGIVKADSDTFRDPTFIAFKSGVIVSHMKSASEFFSSIRDLVNQHADDNSSSAVDSAWLGSALPKNFTNVTHGIEALGLDILNATGSVRTIFDPSKPSGLNNGKGKESDSKDWVESDTDEQLMLFVPFQSAVKLHSIHITSLPPTTDEDEEDDEDDETPSRPETVKLFCNTHQILGFDEADEREATQVVNLKPEDWNEEGTAVITTKFVKFQNCSGLTIFFVDVEREGGNKVRVDRLRMVGEVTVEKIDMTKLKQQEE
jgi:hypothetical protein